MLCAQTPTLTSVSTNPSFVVVSQNFSITVGGSGFNTSTAQLVVTGGACSPSCTLPSSYFASISATSITTVEFPVNDVGTYGVAVQNGSGTPSSSLSFNVYSATPSITTLSTNPSPAVAGQQFSLSVNGTAMNTSNSLILVTGTNCSPCTIAHSALTNVGPTSITGPITLSTSGSYTVAVENGTSTYSSGTLVLSVSSAAPSVSSLSTSPNPAVAGTQFSLTVNGASFDTTDAQIVVTGTNCAPCTIPHGTLTALSATSATGPLTLAASGSYSVEVQNGTSGPVSGTLTLSVSSPTPSATSLSTNPSPAVAGAQFSLSLNGSNFDVTNVQILIAGTNCSPCTIADGSLTTKTATTITGPVTLSAGGSYSVVAQNGSGGPQSGTLTLSVNSPASTLTSLSTSPNPPVAGQQFSLTVNGSGFVTASVEILITGTNCSPCTIANGSLTSAGATSITGPITLSASGSYSVSAQNGPSGASLGTLPLTVNSGTASVSSLSSNPSPAVALQQFSLTVNGSNFDTTNAQIVITGTSCSPCTVPTGLLTSKSGTSVTGPVTLSASGNYSVSVQNGVSGPQSGNLTLSLISPTPSIGSLSTNPNPAVAGQPFTLTVNGSNFDIANVQILLFIGCPSCVLATTLAPTAKSATSVSYAGLQINNAGNYAVAVQNGTSGPQSGTLPVAINSATPVLNSLSTNPSPAVAGQQFSLTVSGSNFNTSNATIVITGANCAPCTIATAALTSDSSTSISGPVTLASAGTYSVLEQNGAAGGAQSGTLTLTVQSSSLQSQTITFGSLSNVTYGVSPFTVSATASSGLTVSFASTTTSICTTTGTNGSTVTIIAGGSCAIAASQAGNGNYSAAAPVTQSFTVNPESQTITFGSLSNVTYGVSAFTVSATASSGLTVAFASTTASVCTVSGNTVTIAVAGSCSIQASQSGNADYAPATNVTQSFNVTQAAQTITFDALSDVTYGVSPFAVAATAGSGLTVAFASTATLVCTVSGNTVTIVAVGICSIQASQSGNADYSPATNVTQSFNITQAAQTITFGALSAVTYGVSPFTVAATASSGLTVAFASTTNSVCILSGNTVTILSVGTCSIQATQSGNANYAAAPNVIQGFTVNAQTGTALGTTSLLVGPEAGSSSVILLDPGAWTAGSNAGFLHISAGNASGTGNAVVVFTYDAYSGTGTQTGTLTIAGLTLTVTQAGANYLSPGPLTTLVPMGLYYPHELAVDGFGNVYVADTLNNAIKEWNASTQQVTTLVSSGLNAPYGVAVDGSGNVYIADANNNAIKEWNASTQQVTTLVSGLSPGPLGVAVDGSGDVYFAYGGAIGEWSASTQQVTTLVSSGLSGPWGVAVDDSGNVYIADTFNNAIKEWNASTQQVSTLVSSGLSQPTGVAVDGSGNVYIADSENNAVKEWSASTQQVITLASRLDTPSGVSVDGSSNVYIADANNSALIEMPNAFVGPAAGLTEGPAAGSDALLQPLPSTASLAGIFAPTSDQSWLSIGPIANGVVNFSFAANTTGSALVAHINILGQQITVTQEATLLSQTIAFGALGNVTYGASPFTISATAGSGLAVAFASTTTSICTVSGTTVTILSGGACSITASQPGDSAYAAATPVLQGFTVNPAAQTIAFGALPTVAASSAPFAVGATASSGLPVAFASTTAPVCTVSGDTVTIVAAGPCSISASQAGNADYAAASPVTRTFAVTANTVTAGTAPAGPGSAYVIPNSVCSYGTQCFLVAAGGAFSIPINLNLGSAVSADSLNFSVQITPNGGAPALTGALGFTPNSSIAIAPVVSGGTSNSIGVAWSGLAPPIGGSPALGTVTGTLPATAAGGQTYTVAVTAAGASLASTPVAVAAGANGAINVGYTYLAGDVAPKTADTAPNFGDGVLNILDLIQNLFAVNSVPGFVPAACSDRLDAMDVYPADTPTTRGGDGVLDIRDLILELFRVNNLNLSRPVRSSLGGLGGSCASGGSSESSSESAAALARLDADRPSPPAADGALLLGAPESTGAGAAQVPVYLAATRGLVNLSLSLAAGDTQSQLHFVPLPAAAPTLVQESRLGVVAVVWQAGIGVPPGGRLLLGYVAGPADAAANLQVFGASASEGGEGRALRLSLPAGSGAR